jgi:hypothetical protein
MDSERHYRSARIMDGKYDGATFPLKKESELTPKARKWLRVARAVLAEMHSKTKRRPVEIYEDQIDTLFEES